jgi:hypothetical protein
MLRRRTPITKQRSLKHPDPDRAQETNTTLHRIIFVS